MIDKKDLLKWLNKRLTITKQEKEQLTSLDEFIRKGCKIRAFNECIGYINSH